MVRNIAQFLLAQWYGGTLSIHFVIFKNVVMMCLMEKNHAYAYFSNLFNLF